jgi:aminoglycoside 6'-N-acetyltransferase
MEYIYSNGLLTVRKMLDIEEDYNTLTKWLSDPEVCIYYEGQSHPFDLAKVKEKFAHRTRGESRVIPCIIEYNRKAIGFVQFYKTSPDEYCKSKTIDMSKYKNPHGIDIIIGETEFWNQGLGTKIMKMTLTYLFDKKNADIVFIDPQTRNVRAIRCYEKSGFQPLMIIKNRELHDDEYKDSLIMYITANDKPLCKL